MYHPGKGCTINNGNAIDLRFINMLSKIIQFDGLYSHIEGPDPQGYIHNSLYRFYPDGSVIHAVISEGKEGGGHFPRGGWFDKDSGKPLLIGKYTLKGNKLTLKYKEDGRKASYEGEAYEGYITIFNQKHVYINFDKIPRE